MTYEKHSLSLSNYEELVSPTDKMPESLPPVLFGIFGEVGSLMAASKKHHREQENFVGFRNAVVEEFGDVLWYLAAICRRLNINLESIFSAIGTSKECVPVIASDMAEWPILVPGYGVSDSELDPALLELGKAVYGLLNLEEVENKNQHRNLANFATTYVQALHSSGMTFGEVARHNASKTRGRFLELNYSDIPTFDDGYEEDERIPDHFEIHITQRKSGKSYLKWNGVFIGDPLTDNIQGEDGYRFHDVFHLAHAAILHWSPVFRGLIKHKRKSTPKIDEAEDGGRASVIEEGLTAWIFSKAKEIGYFEGKDSVSFDLLKTVQNFVSGYEVEKCPLSLWEKAILQGYDAFLQVRKNNGGILIGDRLQRTLEYKAHENGS